MAIAKSYKQLFLSGLRWDAEDAAATLFNTLKAAARARLEDVGQGKVLVSSSQNGFSGTFALPLNGQGMTPQSAAELCAEMLAHYAAAKASLIAGGIATPTDTQIGDEMVLRIDQSAGRETYNDYSGLRR